MYTVLNFQAAAGSALTAGRRRRRRRPFECRVLHCAVRLDGSPPVDPSSARGIARGKTIYRLTTMAAPLAAPALLRITLGIDPHPSHRCPARGKSIHRLAAISTLPSTLSLPPPFALTVLPSCVTPLAGRQYVVSSRSEARARGVYGRRVGVDAERTQSRDDDALSWGLVEA